MATGSERVVVSAAFHAGLLERFDGGRRVNPHQQNALAKKEWYEGYDTAHRHIRAYLSQFIIEGEGQTDD